MLWCVEVKVPEIIITNKIEDIKDSWFYTNRSFNYRDAIKMSTFTAYRSAFRLDKCLKRLHFQSDYSDFKRLNLNNLTQLEELKIHLRISDEEIYDVTLDESLINLPNLKILDIADYDKIQFVESMSLVLTLPKLKALKNDCFDWITLSHPDTITHIEVSDYDEAFGAGNNANSLTNVEYLKIDQNIRWGDEILLENPKLKTLLCNQFDSDYYDDSLELLREFIEQKRTSKRSELQIFFQSVELVDVHKIDECPSPQSILAFQMSNYDYLCDNISYGERDSLDYNELMTLVEGSLPDDFFEKFRNIPSVFVSSGAVNQEHLLKFLQKLKFLKTLCLRNTFLDQNFYDGLYEVGQLTDLIFSKSTLIVSFDFLFKLKLLETMSIYQESPELLDASLALFNELKYFREVEFFYGQQVVEINKSDYELDSNRLYSFRRCKLTHQGSLRQTLFAKERIDFDELSHLVNEHKNGRMAQSQ